MSGIRLAVVPETLDRWAQWLLRGRDGGDRDVLARRLVGLYEIRDRVLDGAAIEPRDVVLDLGCGNGLIALGAIDRAGPSGRVIFSDVSEDLLAECRGIAEKAGIVSSCAFVRASADQLDAIEDASVDVVTARSVLIYLDDKQPAFTEMFRVLKPGGRISLFEPINRFGSPGPEHLFLGFDVRPVERLAAKVKVRYTPPDEHPLANFDERDLFRFAEATGFIEIALDYRAELTALPLDTTDWDVLLRMSGNPLDPTIGEDIRAALTSAEQAEFEAHLRPLVESGQPASTAQHTSSFAPSSHHATDPTSHRKRERFVLSRLNGKRTCRVSGAEAAFRRRRSFVCCQVRRPRP